MSALVFKEILEAKRRYDWVMLLGNAEKSPEICGSWGEIKEKGSQTEEELQGLIDRAGKEAKNWGPITGVDDLFSPDFDWGWVYGLWYRKFGDRAKTLTFQTPNRGARVLFRTKERPPGDPFKNVLNTEFKGNHFVAVGGEAFDINGDLKPYKLILDELIHRDDSIIADTTAFFIDLLEGRYSFLRNECISHHLNEKRPKEGKWIVLNHKQSLARAHWGFLVLNDRRLLTVDGAHKLRMSQWAALAESERSGVVTIAKAAKDSAYARTRQIKIANPIDPDSKRYVTKDLGSFLYPVQATSTFLDLMSVARIDLCVFADSHDVKAKEINVKQSGEYDKRLDLLSETLKWTWGENPKISFTPEAEDKLLSEATNLYNLFFCKGVPLASIDMKWKLARLSASLACLTLSTMDFKRVIVDEDHVNWIVAFLKEEYTNAELHTLAQEMRHEVVDMEDVAHILEIFTLKTGLEKEKISEIIEFIALQGRVTRESLKTKFDLSRDSQLNPLVSTLQNEKLVKVGRGFYPTSKLIHVKRLLSNISKVSNDKNDTPPKQYGGQTKLPEGGIKSDIPNLTNVTENGAPREEGLDLDELLESIDDNADNAINCPHCSDSFTSKPQLARHIEAIHTDVLKEGGG